MSCPQPVYLLLTAAAVAASITSPVKAIPYASALRNTTGNMYEFVLNETADAVTIMRDGGNPILLNTPAAGRHTFDLAGFSTFEIQVAKNSPVGWTEISDAANPHTYYFRPNGVVVNTIPSSPYFGTVYVSHPIEVNVAGSPRGLGDGIYSLTSDLIGVDLANNFAVVTDANAPSLAKAPGWTVDGSTTASPWQIALDDSGNIIASDWSDASGGIKYAAPDLSTGGLVLAIEDGVRPLLLNDNNQEVHGSIVSKPTVTGSVGVDLTVWGVDEDFDLDHDTLMADTGNSLWRWDVGSATQYDGPPELVISSSALNVDEALWFDLNIGVAADAHYEARFDKWYMTQSRTHGNESSLIIVSADGVDGTTPTIEWASRQYSLDHGLDGAAASPGVPEEGLANVEGPQDVFRSIGSVVISDDGTKLFAHRAEQFNEDSADGDNPILGLNSAYPGSILVIPLDENGLPDLELDDNGTPEDTSDDFFTNLDSITIEGQLGRHARAPIALDAAGNVYATNNISELLQVFSPGGNTLAITSSDGTFNLQTVGDVGLPGDYNNDGSVNAADYTVWRDNLGGSGLPNDDTPDIVDGSDYVSWKNNYGSTVGSGSAAVPEPSTMLLVALLGACGLTTRRRR